MALRTLKIVFAALTVAVLAAGPVAACFGPKLYVGIKAEPRQELLFALVSLYVIEKTGVQSEQVVLADDADAGAELRAERIDLAFAPAPVADARTLLAVSGYPLLVSGPRPLNDLQFTTVEPAVHKLASLLTPNDLAVLEAVVAGGEKPLAAARRLFKERRWI